MGVAWDVPHGVQRFKGDIGLYRGRKGFRVLGC